MCHGECFCNHIPRRWNCLFLPSHFKTLGCQTIARELPRHSSGGSWKVKRIQKYFAILNLSKEFLIIIAWNCWKKCQSQGLFFTGCSVDESEIKVALAPLVGYCPIYFQPTFLPIFFCFLFRWTKGGIGWSQLLPQLPTDRKVLSPVPLLLLSSHKNTKNKWEFLKSWKKYLMAHLMNFGLRPPAKPALWSWKKQVCQMSFQARF